MQKPSGLPNIPFPTLGGQQFWLDKVFFAGWRIQKNILTGHHRLLSPGYIRQAWGSFSSCVAALEQKKKQRNLKNQNDHLVLLVHGMAGWTETFFLLEKHLKKEGFFAAGYNYPSLAKSLEVQARDLNSFLCRLEDISKISLIGHSQGGAVIRKALETRGAWQNRIDLESIILIGTPNKGAVLADFTRRVRALGKIAPPVRDQLTKDYAKTMKPPEVRTGLIAGSLRRGKGVNPVIPGNDDGIVGVDEVWIDGIEDRLVIQSDHFTLANRKPVREAVVRFLKGKPLKA